MSCRAGQPGDQDIPLGPLHRRIRAVDRDMVGGGRYGQRSCEPHPKGRTHGSTGQARDVKLLLGNPEPSTHGTKLPNQDVMLSERADMMQIAQFGRA